MLNLINFTGGGDPNQKVYEATIDEMMKRIKSGKVQLKPVETQVGKVFYCVCSTRLCFGSIYSVCVCPTRFYGAIQITIYLNGVLALLVKLAETI